MVLDYLTPNAVGSRPDMALVLGIKRLRQETRGCEIYQMVHTLSYNGRINCTYV
jgi:hypothetical protein